MQTLKRDASLYREATRGNSWEDILQYVRRELDSRVSSFQMGHIPSVQAVRKNEAIEPRAVPPVVATQEIPLQALVAAQAQLGYNVPSTGSTNNVGAQKGAQRGKFRMNRGRGSGGNNRRGPYNGRPSHPTQNRNTPNDRPTPEGTCHWCDMTGHMIANCQAKKNGQGAVFPPKPPGVLWVDHKAANPIKKA